MRNRKYLPNKKNGGNVPVCKDKRMLSIMAKCGKCIECREERAKNWQTRLHEEMKIDKRGKFVTLTFNEEKLAYAWKRAEKKYRDKNNGEIKVTEREVAIVATRDFLERWRKKYKKSVKHWIVAELGHENTERLHLHGILFTDESKEAIEERWQNGWVWIGDYCNERTVNYIVKYITKIDKDHPEFNPRILATEKLGWEYKNSFEARLNKYKPEGGTDETYKLPNFGKITMPAYLKKQMYTEEERENLWIEKMDKGIVYVKGIKIEGESPREIDFNAEKAREYWRRENLRAGYGKNKEITKHKFENNLEFEI